MQPVEMKNVTAADADFLFHLMNDPAIMRILHEPATEPADWVEAVQAWADDEDEEDIILWKDGKQIGWFALNGLQSSDGTVYLKMALLLPAYQHQGIGAYVISQLLDEARRKGYTSMVLYTDQQNTSAQRCYQKCGFQITESLSETMSDGATVPRYQMECRLSSPSP